MRVQCPDSECLSSNGGPTYGSVIRKGAYFRRSDGQRIQRYQCINCRRRFSSGSRNPCFRQKKRTLNRRLKNLLCSGVSQRRAAILLKVNRKTIVRKFRFLAKQACLEHQAWTHDLSLNPLSHVQLDDLETAEHTKCKPLSVSLAVDPKSRKILAFQVSQMPAKGHLAQVAFRKYGPREDQRREGWDALFCTLKSVVKPQAEWLSDENPHYPRLLKAHHPECTHITTPGGRGSVTGQGELKKLGFDPLFSLNHTCAMLRANLNRLFRRTWCVSKNPKGLTDHLWLYVTYHNDVLTSA
jgi:hypothetical protein